MPILKNTVISDKFNREAILPYELRIADFKIAMEDVYDFLFDVNGALTGRGLERIDDMLRPAALSGILSDMMTASMAKHSRTLTQNRYFNGHPDLVVRGIYPNDAVPAGADGVEIKATRKGGGAVDTHGARNQWMCVFVYEVDNKTEPARNRRPLAFTEVYLAQVEESDFRNNARGARGTRTSTLHREGVAKLRRNWIYLLSTEPSLNSPSIERF